MKRSKIVDKIQKFLKDYEDPGFKEERENYASDLLYMLECEGVLPPFSQFFEQQDVLDRWGQCTGEKEMVRLIVPKWEPE